MFKVLLTGVGGYIGSVLCRLLLERGYIVFGIDRLIFGNESLLTLFDNPNFKFFKKDIRDSASYQSILKEVDAVIHLAAIVGDPACSKYKELAFETNWISSKHLYDSAKKESNIKRFIFSSTCSNYGKMNGTSYVDENSSLNPVSLYAELKVKFEEYLLNSYTRSNFVPTSLRFATVYGISPRMRFDLSVNEFTRDIVIKKNLIIFGKHFWRPYCHVSDLAKACISVLEANPSIVDHEVFNVGATYENYTKRDIANLLLKIVPDAHIQYVHKNEDPRDYKVNFEKIHSKLNFRITKRVSDGISEIFLAIKNGSFTDSYSKRHSNILMDY